MPSPDKASLRTPRQSTSAQWSRMCELEGVGRGGASGQVRGSDVQNLFDVVVGESSPRTEEGWGAGGLEHARRSTVRTETWSHTTQQHATSHLACIDTCPPPIQTQTKHCPHTQTHLRVPAAPVRARYLKALRRLGKLFLGWHPRPAQAGAIHTRTAAIHSTWGMSDISSPLMYPSDITSDIDACLSRGTWVLG
jgi:hypothetical protein